jgi:hypothetical protein
MPTHKLLNRYLRQVTGLFSTVGQRTPEDAWNETEAPENSGPPFPVAKEGRRRQHITTGLTQPEAKPFGNLRQAQFLKGLGLLLTWAARQSSRSSVAPLGCAGFISCVCSSPVSLCSITHDDSRSSGVLSRIEGRPPSGATRTSGGHGPPYLTG